MLRSAESEQQLFGLALAGALAAGEAGGQLPATAVSAVSALACSSAAPSLCRAVPPLLRCVLARPALAQQGLDALRACHAALARREQLAASQHASHGDVGAHSCLVKSMRELAHVVEDAEAQLMDVV